MRVLIAEDDAVSRMILQRAVQKFGHEVLVAEDGRKAWKLFRETPDVDVVISDWMMPDMDGLELCIKLREEERDEYTFFIFLTALGDKEHLLEGMQAGADDYLSKPLDRDQLEVRLIAAARVTALHRQLTKQKEELEKLNFELFKQARRDPLTRLGNRLRLHEDLEALRDRVERYGHSYCAVLCDVDSFKPYNDRYGHLKGDEVLQKVAETILRSFRTGDSFYRYGGEEFLIILPEQTLESTALSAERLRWAVEELAITHQASKPGVVTVSCGIAEVSPGENKAIEELLKEADEALYQAKEDGKNKVAVRSQKREVGTKEPEAEA
jgi:diguanylate cyclase (GGDEF)-like protein